MLMPRKKAVHLLLNFLGHGTAVMFEETTTQQLVQRDMMACLLALGVTRTEMHNAIVDIAQIRGEEINNAGE